MLVLPILMFLAFGHRRKNMTGLTIVEALVSRFLHYWCKDCADSKERIVQTLFTFWCLFLGNKTLSFRSELTERADSIREHLYVAATAKLSASYHHLNGWGRRCRFGFSVCSTGRALLSFGWITFGLLSILLPICIIHGILHEKKRHREEGDLREGREIKPNSIPATSPQPAGGGLATTTGAGTTEGGMLNIGPLHPVPAPAPAPAQPV